jgi:uncharacterized protein YlxW (UPF0749 family)
VQEQEQEQEEGAVSTSILDSVLGQEEGSDVHAAKSSATAATTTTVITKLPVRPAADVIGDSATSTAPVMTKAALKKALEEKEAVVLRQQAMIEALERSLQTQRARLVRDLEGYKQQAEQAREEQHRLEAELEKRERFGRNQVRRCLHSSSQFIPKLLG